MTTGERRTSSCFSFENRHSKIDTRKTEYPIDGTLDLHQFAPRDVGSLVPEYLRACREEGLLQVRIIHGKGTGALRRSVHAILEREPAVATFQLAGDRSGWGATLVELAPEERSMDGAAS